MRVANWPSLDNGRDRLVISGRDLLVMPDEKTQGDWRLGRFEQDLRSSREDLKDMRDDMRSGFKEVNVSISNLQSSVQGLMVSMPLTYVTRVDLSERLEQLDRQSKTTLQSIRDGAKSNSDSSQKDIAEIQSTMRQLIFAIIGALISGGLALLIEVLKLLGGGKS
jgi:uncharacterized phage infection (PIP) family protein YhgE